MSHRNNMNDFKVALLQLIAGNNQTKNLEKGFSFCKEAKAAGADLALFPEMWNNGYRLSEDFEKLKESAVSKNGTFVTAFRNLAKELDMAIGITYLEANQSAIRNTVTVFDRFGNEVLTYAKVHTCDFADEKNLEAGEDFYVADLNTKNGNVKIGAMICYDREFPESARILMLKGAEIILVPNACPMELNRLSQLRARAFENMVGIATANYAYGQPDCNGHSSAFDGIAYGEIRPNVIEARDTLVVEAGENEGVFIASFPMDQIRKYRESEVHGNAYRKPRKYALLVSDAVEAPFKRSDRKN